MLQFILYPITIKFLDIISKNNKLTAVNPYRLTILPEYSHANKNIIKK